MGVQIIYVDSVSSLASFELNTEYKGRLVKTLLKPLSTQGIVSDRNDRGQRIPAFPQRLVSSRILEHFRTAILPETEDASMTSFVDEFLEDFIKVLVRALDRDPALITKLLKGKKINDSSTTNEEEQKEEGDGKPWSVRGLIPLLFERLKNHVPAKYFFYNSMLELYRQLCPKEESRMFLEQHGVETLEVIY